MKKRWTLLSLVIILFLFSACSLEKKENIEKIKNIENVNNSEQEDITVEEDNTTWENKQREETNILFWGTNLPKNWKELSNEELVKYLPECEFEELQPAEITNIDDVVQNCKKEEKLGYLGILWETQNDSASFYWVTKNWEILEPYIMMKEKNKFNPTCKIKNNEGIVVLWKWSYSNIDPSYSILQSIITNKKIHNKYINIVNTLPNKLEEKLLQVKDFCIEDCKDFKFRIAIKNNNNYAIGWLRKPDWSGSLYPWWNNFVYLINDKIYSPWKNNYVDLACSDNSCNKWDVYYLEESRRFISSFSWNNLIVKKMINSIPLTTKKLTLIEYWKHTAHWHWWEKDNPFIKYNIETCEIKLD